MLAIKPTTQGLKGSIGASPPGIVEFILHVVIVVIRSLHQVLGSSFDQRIGYHTFMHILQPFFSTITSSTSSARSGVEIYGIGEAEERAVGGKSQHSVQRSPSFFQLRFFLSFIITVITSTTGSSSRRERVDDGDVVIIARRQEMKSPLGRERKQARGGGEIDVITKHRRQLSTDGG